MTTVPLTLALMAAAAPPAADGGGAPEPAPKKGMALTMPPYESYTLDNGLKVLLMEDHSLPKVVVDTWFSVGSYDDPKGASGFAHLFEHLMFMGTRDVGQGQFDATMEAAGAQNNASTGDDRTNYFDWGTSNTLELLLYLEADRMTGLDITKDKLDLQRDVVRNERRQNYEDSPYGCIWVEMPGMLYPDSHPYHLAGIGTHEDLMNASLEHVTNFYQSWYAPNNASLVVVGDFDSEQVKGWIDLYFSQLKPAEIPEHASFPEVKKPVVARKTVTDQIQLPAVVMAWHSPSYFEAGDAEMDVAATLLADGADSRLVKRLVHDEGLAQNVDVFQSSAKRGSVFYVMVIASPDADLDRVEAIVNEELAALGDDHKAEKDELTRVVNGLEMDFLHGLEPFMARAERVQTYIYHVDTPDYLADDLARYRKVTPTGLAAEVNRWLTPDKAAVLRVLPEGADDKGEK